MIPYLYYMLKHKFIESIFYEPIITDWGQEYKNK